MTIKNNIYLKWVLAGLLMGVGFVLPALWIVSLFGGVYFFRLLLTPQTNTQLFLGAWLAWTIKASYAVSFFWSVYPIDWLSVEFSNVQLWLIGFYWFTSALWLGSGALLLVFGYKLVSRYFSEVNKYVPWLLVAIIWLFSEAFGSFIFSAMMYGPGGTLNISYSFGYVGYLLAEHDLLLQVARVGGVYILGFLFVVLVMVGYAIWVNKNQTSKAVVWVVVVILYISSFYPLLKVPTTSIDEGYSVIAIDTYPSRNEADIQSNQKTKIDANSAMLSALERNPDYILLPEDARFFDQAKTRSSLIDSIKVKYNNPNTIIIDSSGSWVGDKKVLQAMLYNGKTETIENLHKRYLVPQGEFLPYFYSTVMRLFGQSGIVEYIDQNLAFTIGPLTKQNNVAIDLPGVLFCFESVDPQGVRRLVAERGDMPFVAHPVSHAWFHNPVVLWRQQDTMLRVQAVWNQQYILSANNYAYSTVYTPNGAQQKLPEIAAGDGWVIKEVIIPRR